MLNLSGHVIGHFFHCLFQQLCQWYDHVDPCGQAGKGKTVSCSKGWQSDHEISWIQVEHHELGSSDVLFFCSFHWVRWKRDVNQREIYHLDPFDCCCFKKSWPSFGSGSALGVPTGLGPRKDSLGPGSSQSLPRTIYLYSSQKSVEVPFDSLLNSKKRLFSSWSAYDMRPSAWCCRAISARCMRSLRSDTRGHFQSFEWLLYSKTGSKRLTSQGPLLHSRLAELVATSRKKAKWEIGWEASNRSNETRN